MISKQLFLLYWEVELIAFLWYNIIYKYLRRSSSHQFKKEYRQVIEKYLGKSDLPEWDNCIEDLAEYIRKQLIDIDMEDLIEQILWVILVGIKKRIA